ncbi:MAG: hypothetical protein U1F47_00990 [Hyphomicrobiales bacterium]|jgi:hypothetical protein
MTSKIRSARPVGKTRRNVLQALAGLAVAPAAATLLQTTPAEAATGRVEFRLVRAGFIFGIGGGSGKLRFNGRTYDLSVGGVSVGATIGLASADFVGKARHLHRASDITGTYTAVGAGLAAAGGGAVARLRNSRGVVLEVSARQIGFMASIDLSGLRLSLAR